MRILRASRLGSTAILLGAFAISQPAWAPPGGNGGGKKGGGQGGGESTIRLCATFQDPDNASNYIDGDGDTNVPFCDGDDGEILIGEGLKLSTVTRNASGRTVTVGFQGSACETLIQGGFGSFMYSSDALDTFFANAQSTEFMDDGCDPGDPFGASFEPDDLACLQDSGVQLPVGEMRQSQGPRYMSMRVNLTDPEGGTKKGDIPPLVLTFAEDLGQNVCDIGDAALPVAIECTAEESEACTAWHLKAFRACAFDYDKSQGGNWRAAALACPVSTEITFTVKP